jgi:serralysin
MNLAVSLSTPSGRPVTFRATTADGTATAGSDYEARSDVVEILPGQAGGWASVPILGDRVAEPTEDFSVELTDLGNATPAGSLATGTILDDDPPGLSVNDVTVVEPRTGTRDAVFTVTITPAPAGTVTVDYATEAGTAISPDDYAAGSGQLSFDAANVTRTVTVAVNADSLAEPEEFKLRLSTRPEALPSSTEARAPAVSSTRATSTR